jgi:hypothetical protein
MLQGVTGGEALNHISPNMVIQVFHFAAQKQAYNADHHP